VSFPIISRPQLLRKMHHAVKEPPTYKFMISIKGKTTKFFKMERELNTTNIIYK
jgi:hypothetical protein